MTARPGFQPVAGEGDPPGPQVGSGERAYVAHVLASRFMVLSRACADGEADAVVTAMFDLMRRRADAARADDLTEGRAIQGIPGGRPKAAEARREYEAACKALAEAVGAWRYTESARMRGASPFR